MWKDAITVDVVSCLIAEQFPQWAHLPVTPVALDGWDNTTFRLGESMSVRLPSHERYVPQIDKEHRWLPQLAPRLPLPVPTPLGLGRPGCGFAAPWSVYGWLDGEPAALVDVRDLDALAGDVAGFLNALHELPTDGGPAPGPHSFERGAHVSVWEPSTRAAIDQLAGEIDTAAVVDVWEAAIATEWRGPDVWVHGDVTGSNLLVRDDRLCGVIDWGCSAVGDPACDLVMAWTTFDGSSRDHFRRALPLDSGTWARARGWALWKALVQIPGRAADDPGRTGARFGWRWDAFGVLDQVLAADLS